MCDVEVLDSDQNKAKCSRGRGFLTLHDVCIDYFAEYNVNGTAFITTSYFEELGTFSYDQIGLQMADRHPCAC
jgi:hypothetical protein